MDEAQLLLSRLDDLIWNNGYDNCGFLGFLNERECALACSYLHNKGVSFSLNGGYDNATRVYIAVSEVENIDFPISVLKISSKGSRELTHRDFLGSLMGLGIKRECVGDIVMLGTKDAVVFVRDDIADHIIRELNKVGRDAVTVSYYTGDTAELCTKTEEMRLIVTSMRIDNFVSACIGRSRSDAVDLIEADMVFINYMQTGKPSRNISEGDIISIRGYGKFIVGSLSGRTKRDRLIINVLHYI